MGISIWQILIILIVVIPIIWIYGRILNKAGFSRWWTPLIFIPIVNIIMIWVFAFAKWPRLEKK
jgi:uncharacterized membrane protein YhaH (DUF805 family)